MAPWILISITAYLLIALQTVLDKFLLSSKRVSHPTIYAFYSGVLSLFTLLIFAFGVHLVSFGYFCLLIVSGAIFTYGVLCLFFAINVSSASQVVPVVGSAIPIASYLLSFIFAKENFNPIHLVAIGALIFGGLLISFDLPLKLKKKNLFEGFYLSILSGILLALAYTLFKSFYEHDSFANVFVWTRIGLFAGAMTLLTIPVWRKKIINSFHGLKRHEDRREHAKTGALFILNKIFGGAGSLLVNYAISIGSVTAVNALVSAEYIFIFIIGAIFSIWLPKIFQEKWSFWHVAQKVSAIAVITIGIILISK
jgi:drug/metabolite transporter (DMT)-like permease